MILDELTEFCDATALNTGAAGGYMIGAAVDLGVAQDLGAGQPAYLVITIDTLPTSGGAATASFELRSDSTAVIDPTTGTLHLATPAFTIAQMAAGNIVYMGALPMEGNVYERFIGIIQRTAVAAFTAGKVNAFITMNQSKWKAYADANN